YGLPKISSTYGSASLLFIRKDWLDNLSLEIPTTMEEVKAVAHAFTYDDPDGNGQNDTYGFAFSGVDVVCSGWGDVSLFFDAFGAHIGNGGLAIVEQEDGSLAWGGTNVQGMKDTLTMLHDMYVDGSLAKDFLTMTGSSIAEEAGSGRCGMFVGPMWGAMNPAWQAVKIDPTPTSSPWKSPMPTRA
ncbi:MAG: extracellular solute-binding protein, partial [Aristaeellaceae bacterium]